MMYLCLLIHLKAWFQNEHLNTLLTLQLIGSISLSRFQLYELGQKFCIGASTVGISPIKGIDQGEYLWHKWITSVNHFLHLFQIKA